MQEVGRVYHMCPATLESALHYLVRRAAPLCTCLNPAFFEQRHGAAASAAAPAHCFYPRPWLPSPQPPTPQNSSNGAGTNPAPCTVNALSFLPLPTVFVYRVRLRLNLVYRPRATTAACPSARDRSGLVPL